ncbi:MAG: hypothetical protein D6740_07175, partial [Alphaproteobacteria bacterium]
NPELGEEAMQRIRRSSAWWRRTIEEWEQSGKPAKTFCAERGLPKTTFWKWRRRLRQDGDATKPPKFVPLRLGPAPVAGQRQAQPSGVEIVLPVGYRLRLDRGFDPDTLLAALAVLEGRPC